jgi:hypothetical protein
MILIGIKNEHAHGSSNSEEGVGGFSINANSVHVILKEGTKEDLIQYVKDRRHEIEYAKPRLEELNDRLEWDRTLTEREYDEQSDLLEGLISFQQYKQLLIVEGFVI